MSSGYQQGMDGFVPLAVNKTSFLGVIWGSAGVSFVFLLFRGYVRVKAYRRLLSDDFMVLLAWTLLLVYAVLWQVDVDYLHLTYAVDIGATKPPADFLSILEKYLKRTLALSILNICSLWAVKTSFLIFFFKLGHNMRGHRLLWWAAVAACIIGFAISIGMPDYQCVPGSISDVIAKCSGPANGAFVRLSLRLQAASDIITNGFILAIPFKILSNVRIRHREKTILLLLFSLTLFTMVVAIIKVTLTIRTTREDDSWLFTWAAVDSAVAIIIASAISYRSFFRKDCPREKSSGQNVTRPLWYGASFTQQLQGNENSIRGGKESSASSLGEEVVPLDSIHVQHEYAVISELVSATSNTI